MELEKIQLTTALFQIIENAQKMVPDHAEDITQEFLEVISKYADQHAANMKEDHFRASEEAYVFMNDLDEIFDKSRVTCKKGCSFCCNILVSITPGEAKLIWHWVNLHNIPVDMKRLEEQSTEKDEHVFMLTPFRRCVFLQDDNTCGIYKVRPMSCRKYYSMGDPADCNAVEHPHGQVSVIANTDAEAFTSGVISAEGEFGGMGEMLLKYNPNNGSKNQIG